MKYHKTFAPQSWGDILKGLDLVIDMVDEEGCFVCGEDIEAIEEQIEYIVWLKTKEK